MLTAILILAGLSIYAKGLRNQRKIESETATDLEQIEFVLEGCQNNPKLLQNRAWELSGPKAFLRSTYFSPGHSTLGGFTWAKLTSVQENLEGNLETRKDSQVWRKVGEGGRTRPDLRRTLWGTQFVRELLQNQSNMHLKSHSKSIANKHGK